MDVTWQPRRVDWNVHAWNNDDFTVLVSGGGICPWVSMCTVWLLHSKWLSRATRLHQFTLTLNILLWKLLGWFRRPQLWATGDWQLHHDNAPVHASYLMQRFFWWNIKSPGWLSPLIAQIWHLMTSDIFPKLKSPLKGKRFQTIDEIQENKMGQLMVIGRTVWGPKVPTLKGAEVSLSYV